MPEQEGSQQRRSTWMVDKQTGRVVRRDSTTLSKRVQEKLAEALTEGALALNPEEADPRMVLPAAPAEATPEPMMADPVRPEEVHAMPDARALGREHQHHR